MTSREKRSTIFMLGYFVFWLLMESLFAPLLIFGALSLISKKTYLSLWLWLGLLIFMLMLLAFIRKWIYLYKISFDKKKGFCLFFEFLL
jgi:hypothetical protein